MSLIGPGIAIATLNADAEATGLEVTLLAVGVGGLLAHPLINKLPQTLPNPTQ